MRRFILLMALVLFAVSSQAQLLWRVSGKGLVKDSYIFGTMHTAPESMIDEVAGLNDAIRHCDIAISESGNDELNPMDKKEFLRKMIAPIDSTLDNLLSPEDYRIVEAVVDSCFSSQGLSLAQLRFLRPNFISYLLDFSEAIDKGKDFKSLDDHVLDRAVAAGHPTMSLDSIEQVMENFCNCPLADQAAWLLEQCKNDYSQEKEDDTDRYLRQEAIETFEDIAANELDERFLELMVYSRNRYWITKLVPVLASGKFCLVVVGIGHLPSEQGLLQLLRNEGYTVEPAK